MLAILAQAQAQPNAIVSFLPLLLIGVVFYFLLIRPQNQRRRAQMEMQSSIEVGDDIVTTAGIYGTITEIDDDFGIVTVEVAPGVDARAIELAIDGATKLAIGSDGSLEIETPAGTLIQKAPRVIQDGRELPTKYELTGKSRVRFDIEGYDRTLAVLIDPALAYSTYLGGSEDEYADAVAVDGSGNVYLVGETASMNFPTASAFKATYGGGNTDAFVAKLN